VLVWNIQIAVRGFIVKGMALAVMKIAEMNSAAATFSCSIESLHYRKFSSLLIKKKPAHEP
jgi:hypothetical protein